MVDCTDPLWRITFQSFVMCVTTTFVGHPFDTIKVRLQAGNTHNIFRNVYNGVSFPLVGSCPSWTVSFWIYAKVMKELEDRGRTARNHLVTEGMVGALAGLAWGGLINQFDLLKCHAQHHRVSSRVAFRQIMRRGPLAVTRGISFGLTRDTIGTSVYFMTYSHCKSKLDMHSLYAGGWAGFVLWNCIYWIDTMKTRFQTDWNIKSWKQTWQECKMISRPEKGALYCVMVSRAALMHGIGWWASDLALGLVDDAVRTYDRSYNKSLV